MKGRVPRGAGTRTQPAGSAGRPSDHMGRIPANVEEDVATRRPHGAPSREAWPPILCTGLRVVFVGYNPSPRSLASGHHYAHPNNGFWQLLAEAGLTPRRLTPDDDVHLPTLGYGFTDIVGRATAAASALCADELRRGGASVRAELAHFVPAIAAYTGKGVYRTVGGLALAAAIEYGRQAEAIVPGVLDFVLPSPSGRSALPRSEKLRWYRCLAELLPGAEGAGQPGPRP